MRVGIAFDLAPTIKDESGPDDRFEEFDRPETVDAVARVLSDLGHDVVLLGDGREFLTRILDDRPDLVWNMAEGEGVGRSREARVPAACEMLGIPYTGSDPLTMAATLDKDVAKRLVASHGISVPRGAALPPWLDQSEVRRLLGDREGDAPPWIFKPAFEGSSKGIRGKSLAYSHDEAWCLYALLSNAYEQTILGEEFIVGDELTVGLTGTGEVLGAMRVVPRVADDTFVYSLDVKRDWRARVTYETPAILAPDVERRLFDAAKQAYAGLGCRDLARIDFRLRDGMPYFIEANPLPGLAPVTSDLVILAEGYGLDHAALIRRILAATLDRIGYDG